MANPLSGAAKAIGSTNETNGRASYTRLDQKLELAFEKLLRDKTIGQLPKPCIEIIAKSFSEIV